MILLTLVSQVVTILKTPNFTDQAARYSIALSPSSTNHCRTKVIAREVMDSVVQT